MIVRELLDLTDASDGKVVGKHSVWVPRFSGQDWGVKVPFQWGGRVQKYRHPREGLYPLDSVAAEVALLRFLASRFLAPRVGELVYFKTVVSEHPGAAWADPCGAYGYIVQDARLLPPGDASTAALAELRARGEVLGSDGAWADLLVPERDNVVNGYVVDVRRSGFDVLRLAGEAPPFEPIDFSLEAERVADRLARDGAFPFRRRERPYQETYLGGRWLPGERDVVRRAVVLGFCPQPGESVVDLGCCTGGFLQLAALAGAGPLVGVDGQAEFVDLARDVARVAGWNICSARADLLDRGRRAGIVDWVRLLCPGGPDHLLVLSMGKHLSQPALWWWVDAVGARRTYLETNACEPGDYPLRASVEGRGGRYVGDTSDRNLRRCYVVERSGAGAGA